MSAFADVIGKTNAKPITVNTRKGLEVLAPGTVLFTGARIVPLAGRQFRREIKRHGLPAATDRLWRVDTFGEHRAIGWAFQIPRLGGVVTTRVYESADPWWASFWGLERR